MSWSVNAVGKASAVKAALVKQFEYAKNGTVSVPHEHESVKLVEQIVIGQLDFLASIDPPVAVLVQANGSAYRNPNSGHSSIQLKVEPLQGFVE